jgi:phage baseplate assembly protein W
LSVAGSKDFLGVGWKFSVQTDSRSMIKLSRYEEDIKEAIWIILGTSRGERVMRPDFGCGIHDFVFESINASTLANIEQSVREALILWEPRIKLVDVNVSDDQIDNGKLIISIEYIVTATNSRFNLVYPFYLNEGS